MIGLGFDSTSFRSLELSLLNVRRSSTLEVVAKSSAIFGDIGDGVESPGRMTAVGGEVMYRGRCMGDVRLKLCYDFSALYPLARLSRTAPFQIPVRTPRFVSHVTFLPLSHFASSSFADVVPLHRYLGL